MGGALYIKNDNRPNIVTLPDGSILSKGDLPDPATKRWVIRHKVTVVLAVRSDLISLEEACEMYGLSEEEFGLWEEAMLNHGRRGLRVTHLKKYRQPKVEVLIN